MFLIQRVGIDISKAHFHACFSVKNLEGKIKIKGTRKFDNTSSGFSHLLEWVNKKRDQQAAISFVMEATGTYYEKLAWYLYREEQSISVLLPQRAKRYLQAIGKKSKNDTIDAKGLAQMGIEQDLSEWQPLSKEVYRLRVLCREQERLQEAKTTAKNASEALSHGMFTVEETQKRIQEQVELFDKLIKDIKTAIRETVEADEKLRERTEKICQIKGVSVLTVAAVIAETNGFALVENQAQLVSYAGYDVTENQSGKRTGKTRISKKGNAHIRRNLHFPAFNVVRYEVGPFKVFYDRLIKRGKTKMQVYTAIQKKILVIIWTLWRKNEAFDPAYSSQLAAQQE